MLHEHFFDNGQRLAGMNVFIDGDSFVREAKELVIRWAIKGKLDAYFVANKPLSLPKTIASIHFHQVASTPDAADDYIVEQASVGDIVLTRDIILASRLLEQEVLVLNDRGYQFSKEDIHVKLSERLVMLRAREAGLYVAANDSRYTKKDLANFANSLYNIMSTKQREIVEVSRLAKEWTFKD
jgi:uncharacterized protein